MLASRADVLARFHPLIGKALTLGNTNLDAAIGGVLRAKAGAR